MNNLSQKLDMVQECIRKGERVRILYDIILKEIGMTYENEGREVFKKLGEVQDEYYEAIQALQAIMESGKRSKQEFEQEIEKTDGGVSVSN